MSGRIPCSRSPVAAGWVVSLVVLPGVIRDADLDATVSYDIRDESPDNELLLLMAEAWPGQTVYLNLTEPVLGEGGIPVNIEGSVTISALVDHWDAVILLAETNRIPIPGGS